MQQEFTDDRMRFFLGDVRDAERTRQLLQQAPAVYRTQVNDLLLTALARVLCQWTNTDSALVQLEGHGREDLFDDVDLSRTVGWFTALFPVLLDAGDPVASLCVTISGQHANGELIDRIGHEVRNAARSISGAAFDIN